MRWPSRSGDGACRQFCGGRRLQAGFRMNIEMRQVRPSWLVMAVVQPVRRSFGRPSKTGALRMFSLGGSRQVVGWIPWKEVTTLSAGLAIRVLSPIGTGTS